jgi:uncharacterized protein (DUF302 family)
MESGFAPLRVQSSVSFQGTVDNLRKLVAKNGMMVMGEVNQGKIMSMAGMSMKATSLLIGNPMVGKRLFGNDIGAAVAAPFRVTVYEDSSGKVFIAYFKPSDLLSSFSGEQISMAASDLDKKLGMLAQMAGK